MDKEIREKIHFVAIRDLEEPEGGQVYCNCGLSWPCPILRVYEDAENLKAGILAPLPAREATFVWRCACGTLNDYKVGETPFCSGCRVENPVVDAAYTIEEARHWPTNLRK